VAFQTCGHLFLTEKTSKKRKVRGRQCFPSTLYLEYSSVKTQIHPKYFAFFIMSKGKVAQQCLPLKQKAVSNEKDPMKRTRDIYNQHEKPK